MAQPYVGQIMLMSFQFAPRGFALCNGQTMPINQNQALFALLGTTYGGDGTTTFQLPNLQSRVPIGAGNGAGLTPTVLGETGGAQSVQLLTSQVPAHSHMIPASTATGTTNVPTTVSPAVADASSRVNFLYGAPLAVALTNSMTQLNPGAVESAGGNQGHNNLMPYLTINFVIALQGIFPSRN